jgi:TonB family protein
MATVTTSEFVKTREPVASFSMIEHKGIFARLVEEGSLAIGDFTRDPRGFLREIFSNEAKDAQRSKRLRMGLAFGLAFQVVAITAIAIAGWHHATTANNTGEPEIEVKIYDFGKTPPPDNIKNSSTQNESSGKDSDVPKGSPSAGSQSGGGGQEDSAPVQKGVIPPRLPYPSIIAPDVPPSSKPPTIETNYHVEGIETPSPPADTKIGVLNGTPNTDSGGRGSGDGLGEGKGPGVGNNKGSGDGNTPGGRGVNGGTKGGPLGSIEGTTATGPIDIRVLSKIPDSTPIRWIHRVRPIITPEAQADKIVGYVVLEATFNADGTITDIRVRQSLQSMDDEAVAALKMAKFSPATVKGVPVTLLRVPIKVGVNMN